MVGTRTIPSNWNIVYWRMGRGGARYATIATVDASKAGLGQGREVELVVSVGGLQCFTPEGGDVDEFDCPGHPIPVSSLSSGPDVRKAMASPY